MFSNFAGISYLSREQETAAEIRIGNPRPSTLVVDSSFAPSVADSIFMERLKSRVIRWKSVCQKPKDSRNGTENVAYRFFFFKHLICFYFFSNVSSNFQFAEVLINSLRKLILGSEYYGSRPSINLDVCSERQVQLVLEVTLYLKQLEASIEFDNIDNIGSVFFFPTGLAAGVKRIL